jgi:hypothetical protein
MKYVDPADLDALAIFVVRRLHEARGPREAAIIMKVLT